MMKPSWFFRPTKWMKKADSFITIKEQFITDEKDIPIKLEIPKKCEVLG